MKKLAITLMLLVGVCITAAEMIESSDPWAVGPYVFLGCNFSQCDAGGILAMAQGGNVSFGVMRNRQYVDHWLNKCVGKRCNDTLVIYVTPAP